MYSIYDEIIQSWGKGFTEKFVETSYGKTYVLEYDGGHPETVILLHGMLANSCMWSALIPYLSKNYNLILLDIPLEPGKSEPSNLYKKNSDGANWLKSVIEKLNLERINIVGGSLGGWIAIEYIKDNPNMVRSLAIISPHPLRGPVISTSKPWKIAWYALRLAISPKPEYAELMLNEMYSPATQPNELDYNLFVNTIIASKMRAAPRDTPIKTLKKVTCPTLLLVGDGDINMNVKKLDQCMNAFPNAQYEIVQDAGHMLPCEKPNIVSERVNEFLCSLT